MFFLLFLVGFISKSEKKRSKENISYKDWSYIDTSCLAWSSRQKVSDSIFELL